MIDRGFREASEELLQRVVAFEVIKKRLDRNPGALKNGGAPENLGIHRDQIARIHV